MNSRLIASLYRNRTRLLVVGLLVICTLFSLAMLFTRWFIIGHRLYAYLIWDLFLAWVPFWIAVVIYALNESGYRKPRLLLALGFTWLLFFPNAPYLLTEFTHLTGRYHGGPWWCDLVMTVSFALNGLILGLVSLYAIHQVVAQRFSSRRAWQVVTGSLLLGSYGISLGRFQRFNSWDVLHQPFKLIADVADEFLRPSAHAKLFVTAVLLFGVLSMAYMMLWTLMAMEGTETRKACLQDRSTEKLIGPRW